MKALTLAATGVALTLSGVASPASTTATPDEARRIAKEAYIYAFSPVYAYRYLQDEVFNEKSTSYIGAFNRIRNYQRLNTPEDKGGFVSVTMYNLPQRLLIHSPLERYSISDRTPDLKRGPDGSIKVFLQPTSPGSEQESNWLPTPPEGPFMYVIRIYLPGEAVQKGTWQVPKPILADGQ